MPPRVSEIIKNGGNFFRPSDLILVIPLWWIIKPTVNKTIIFFLFILFTWYIWISEPTKELILYIIRNGN